MFLHLGGYHYLIFSTYFDMEFLGLFLSFPLGRLYIKDIFKDQSLLLNLNNSYGIPIGFLSYCSCPHLFAFVKLYFILFFSATTCLG